MAERLPGIRWPPALPVNQPPLAAGAAGSLRHERQGAATRPVRNIRTLKGSQRSEPDEAPRATGDDQLALQHPAPSGTLLGSPHQLAAVFARHRVRGHRPTAG